MGIEVLIGFRSQGVEREIETVWERELTKALSSLPANTVIVAYWVHPISGACAVEL